MQIVKFITRYYIHFGEVIVQLRFQFITHLKKTWKQHYTIQNLEKLAYVLTRRSYGNEKVTEI